MEDFVIANLETKDGLILSRNDFLDLLQSIDARIYFLKDCAKNCRERKAHSLANETYFKIDILEHLQTKLTKLLD